MPVFRHQTDHHNVDSVEVDENVLVERSLHDRRAFAPLYGRSSAPIYGYCYHRLGSRQLAEDATSVIFAKALTSLSGYRGPSFRAWLFGIAHHVVADAQRARGSDDPIEAAATTIDNSPSPEDLAIASDD